MAIVGITGGVASGKSHVAKLFEGFGAFRIDADLLGHQVLNDAEVVSMIVDRWGESIVDEHKLPIRKLIAEKVFAQSADGANDLAFLESITHPRIKRRIDDLVRDRSNYGKVVILDAALLHKAGWDNDCDTIVFVDTIREVRLARAKQRGWSESEFNRREDAQLPIEEKRAKADIVIDNSGTLEETHAQIRQIWEEITT